MWREKLHNNNLSLPTFYTLPFSRASVSGSSRQKIHNLFTEGDIFTWNSKAKDEGDDYETMKMKTDLQFIDLTLKKNPKNPNPNP